MADDDPPPKADGTHQDVVNPVVLDFLKAMQATEFGTTKIDAVGRKLFTYKVSLYLSIDDPSVTNAVRDEFAKFLNELSKFSDLKGANLQVTNCNDAFLLVPGLLHDEEFQKLTGWECVKPGKTRNVYLCIKMKSSNPFSRLKHRMKPFLFARNLLMKRNHSLGDSSEEMATIGYLSPVHPDLLLANIQTELNTEIQCINAQKDDDYLVEHGLFRGVRGELVISHGAVRGKSKQHGDVVNSKAVVVECPKSKTGYYLQNVQSALRIFHWSPDMQKVKFVPFALKADSKTHEIFTNMIIYNSIENKKKIYAQILGVSRDDMSEIRSSLMSKGPSITHIEPTNLTDKQGRWKIYTRTDNLHNLDKWLNDNLSLIVNSIPMRIPVTGFETPRIVASNRFSVSSVHVQEIEAIATTVPDLDDVSTFPNLVVNRRSSRTQKNGAWNSSLLISGTPSPERTQPMSTVPFSPDATSPVLLGLAKQLEDNRKWRVNLEKSLKTEKDENKAFREIMNSFKITIEQELLEFRQQLESTTQVLSQVTAGQTDMQKTMTLLDRKLSADGAAMRADMIHLTAQVTALLHLRTSDHIATPPRLLRTDPDAPLSDSESDTTGPDQKRSLQDRSPNKQTPRAHKTLRSEEPMNLDDDQSARQP